MNLSFNKNSFEEDEIKLKTKQTVTFNKLQDNVEYFQVNDKLIFDKFKDGEKLKPRPLDSNSKLMSEDINEDEDETDKEKVIETYKGKRRNKPNETSKTIKQIFNFS